MKFLALCLYLTATELTHPGIQDYHSLFSFLWVVEAALPPTSVPFKGLGRGISPSAAPSDSLTESATPQSKKVKKIKKKKKKEKKEAAEGKNDRGSKEQRSIKGIKTESLTDQSKKGKEEKIPDRTTTLKPKVKKKRKQQTKAPAEQLRNRKQEKIPDRTEALKPKEKKKRKLQTEAPIELLENLKQEIPDPTTESERKVKEERELKTKAPTEQVRNRKQEKIPDRTTAVERKVKKKRKLQTETPTKLVEKQEKIPDGTTALERKVKKKRKLQTEASTKLVKKAKNEKIPDRTTPLERKVKKTRKLQTEAPTKLVENEKQEKTPDRTTPLERQVKKTRKLQTEAPTKLVENEKQAKIPDRTTALERKVKKKRKLQTEAPTKLVEKEKKEKTLDRTTALERTVKKKKRKLQSKAPIEVAENEKQGKIPDRTTALERKVKKKRKLETKAPTGVIENRKQEEMPGRTTALERKVKKKRKLQSKAEKSSMSSLEASKHKTNLIDSAILEDKSMTPDMKAKKVSTNKQKVKPKAVSSIRGASIAKTDSQTFVNKRKKAKIKKQKKIKKRAAAAPAPVQSNLPKNSMASMTEPVSVLSTSGNETLAEDQESPEIVRTELSQTLLQDQASELDANETLARKLDPTFAKNVHGDESPTKVNVSYQAETIHEVIQTQEELIGNHNSEKPKKAQKPPDDVLLTGRQDLVDEGSLSAVDEDTVRDSSNDKLHNASVVLPSQLPSPQTTEGKEDDDLVNQQPYSDLVEHSSASEVTASSDADFSIQTGKAGEGSLSVELPSDVIVGQSDGISEESGRDEVEISPAQGPVTFPEDENDTSEQVYDSESVESSSSSSLETTASSDVDFSTQTEKIEDLDSSASDVKSDGISEESRMEEVETSLTQVPDTFPEDENDTSKQVCDSESAGHSSALEVTASNDADFSIQIEKADEGILDSSANDVKSDVIPEESRMEEGEISSSKDPMVLPPEDENDTLEQVYDSGSVEYSSASEVTASSDADFSTQTEKAEEGILNSSANDTKSDVISEESRMEEVEITTGDPVTLPEDGDDTSEQLDGSDAVEQSSASEVAAPSDADFLIETEKAEEGSLDLSANDVKSDVISEDSRMEDVEITTQDPVTLPEDGEDISEQVDDSELVEKSSASRVAADFSIESEKAEEGSLDSNENDVKSDDVSEESGMEEIEIIPTQDTVISLEDKHNVSEQVDESVEDVAESETDREESLHGASHHHDPKENSTVEELNLIVDEASEDGVMDVIDDKTNPDNSTETDESAEDKTTRRKEEEDTKQEEGSREIVEDREGGDVNDTETTMDEDQSSNENTARAVEAKDSKNDTASEMQSSSTTVKKSSRKIGNRKPDTVKKSESKIVRRTIDTSALSGLRDSDSDLIVSIVTWNLAEESPAEDEASFIKKFSKGEQSSDFVLISAQECENIKPRRTEGHRSRELRSLMVQNLGRKYMPLAIHSLGGIQFGLFCKQSMIGEIEHISVADVTCGIGNVFHNKGAIAAFVKVKAKKSGRKGEVNRSKPLKMMFVTAHMAAHVKKFEDRDSDFWRIVSELESKCPEHFFKYNAIGKETAGMDLLDSMDRIFFCGDLNYRLDLPREEVEETIQTIEKLSRSKTTDAKHRVEMLQQSLLRHDQLYQSMTEQRAFPGFSEGKIAFLPTFKYDKGTSDYDTSHKQRIPAWTDRVLFKGSSETRVVEYNSVTNAMHSDHRPVFATFRVGRHNNNNNEVVVVNNKKKVQQPKQQRKSSSSSSKKSKKDPKQVKHSTTTSKMLREKKKKKKMDFPSGKTSN